MQEIIAEGGYSIRVLYDPDNTFADFFEIQELPVVLIFIIDRSGIIRYRARGVDPGEIGNVIDTISE
jgi:hypothetical protein